MMDGLYVKNADGQYVNISKGTPVPITEEDKIATKQRSIEYQQKLETEKMKKIEVGTPKIGNASIYSTIEAFSPKEYSISIIKADNYKNSNKNIVIKITDKELLASTGGIVQGMSGSPIVQEGKIVGAVTHVFLNDPSRGFGISISNMINN